MANASDVQAVRYNTDELSENNYDDSVIGKMVDELGVAGASARLWEIKAASFTSLVDTSEAGASHKFSDLRKNALEMATHFRAQSDEPSAGVDRGIIVRKIIRS